MVLFCQVFLITSGFAVFIRIKKKKKKRIYCIPVYIIHVCTGPKSLALSRCFVLMGFYAYRRKAHRSLWTKFFFRAFIVSSGNSFVFPPSVYKRLC